MNREETKLFMDLKSDCEEKEDRIVELFAQNAELQKQLLHFKLWVLGIGTVVLYVICAVVK